MNNLYFNKLDNLDKIDKILETHKLSILIQEEIENLNRAITSKELTSVIPPKKKFLQRKVQDQMVSLVNFTTYLKKK